MSDLVGGVKADCVCGCGLFGGLLPGERRAMRRGYGNFERQYADGSIVGVRTTRNV